MTNTIKSLKNELKQYVELYSEYSKRMYWYRIPGTVNNTINT